MTNSYDSSRDVYSENYRKSRAPARDATLVTPSDAYDLPVYGKLMVFNAHATAAEVIRVVPVAKSDDAAYIDIHVPVGLTVIDWLIVRAVRIAGTGADISAWVLTS